MYVLKGGKVVMADGEKEKREREKKGREWPACVLEVEECGGKFSTADQ